MGQTIQITGLSRVDMVEIQQADKDHLIKFAPTNRTTERHGEMGTVTAVVIMSLAALRVLAVWLARHHTGQHYKRVIHFVDADGAEHTEQIEFSTSASEAPTEQALNALKAVLNVDR